MSDSPHPADATDSRFMAVFQASPLPMATYDLTGHVLLWNPAAERVFGYRADEVMGRSLPRVPEEHWVEQAELVQRTLAGGDCREVPTVRVHRDGRRIEVLLSAAAVRNAAGTQSGFLAVTSPVSDRDAAALALSESEARFRALVSNSTDAVAIYAGPGGLLTYASPSSLAVLGWTADELVGHRPSEFIPEAHHSVLRDHVAAVLGGATDLPPAQVGLHQPDGGLRWIDVAVTDQLANPVVGGIVLNCRNITERVLGEEALRHSEERFRSLVDGIEEVLFSTDADGRLTYLNAAWTRYTGMAIADSLGADMLDLVDPRDLAEAARLVDDLLGGRIRTAQITARFPMPDGRTGWFEARGRPVAGTGGSVIGITGTLCDVTARVQAEIELTYLASHDPLTGLLNRNALLDHLSVVLLASPGATGAAVLFVDLDRFKQVNDSLGHEAGDALLVSVAGRLAGALEEGEVAARFGGDEFVVVSAGHDAGCGASEVVDRVRAALARPVELRGAPYGLGASIGVALGAPGDDAGALIHEADLALYRAKELGRGRTAVFEPSMRDRVRYKLSLEAELRRALERDELVLHHQPVFDLATGAPVGVEALVRWDHPAAGLMGPAEFVPVAEDSGLIIALGEWVLETALVESRRWSHLDVDGSLRTSVNVSARQLVDGHLPRTVERVLRRAKVQGANLCLELTESALLADLDAGRAALEALAGLGVAIAIDDFGTGYSSLAYLHDLPVTQLKIDRSFVAGLPAGAKDRTLVASIVTLAGELGLVSVAEGVETDEQLSALAAMGCDRVQGYLLARPVPAAEVPALLTRRVVPALG